MGKLLIAVSSTGKSLVIVASLRTHCQCRTAGITSVLLVQIQESNSKIEHMPQLLLLEYLPMKASARTVKCIVHENMWDLGLHERKVNAELTLTSSLLRSSKYPSGNDVKVWTLVPSCMSRN